MAFFSLDYPLQKKFFFQFHNTLHIFDKLSNNCFFVIVVKIKIDEYISRRIWVRVKNEEIAQQVVAGTTFLAIPGLPTGRT